MRLALLKLFLSCSNSYFFSIPLLFLYLRKLAILTVLKFTKVRRVH